MLTTPPHDNQGAQLNSLKLKDVLTVRFPLAVNAIASTEN